VMEEEGGAATRSPNATQQHARKGWRTLAATAAGVVVLVVLLTLVHQPAAAGRSTMLARSEQSKSKAMASLAAKRAAAAKAKVAMELHDIEHKLTGALKTAAKKMALEEEAPAAAAAEPAAAETPAAEGEPAAEVCAAPPSFAPSSLWHCTNFRPQFHQISFGEISVPTTFCGFRQVFVIACAPMRINARSSEQYSKLILIVSAARAVCCLFASTP